jgi:hypothetical protein
VRTTGRLRARYHRLVLRCGGYRNPVAKKKAIVATAHILRVIIWTSWPMTPPTPTWWELL